MADDGIVRPLSSIEHRPDELNFVHFYVRKPDMRAHAPASMPQARLSQKAPMSKITAPKVATKTAVKAAPASAAASSDTSLKPTEGNIGKIHRVEELEEGNQQDFDGEECPDKRGKNGKIICEVTAGCEGRYCAEEYVGSLKGGPCTPPELYYTRLYLRRSEDLEPNMWAVCAHATQKAKTSVRPSPKTEKALLRGEGAQWNE